MARIIGGIGTSLASLPITATSSTSKSVRRSGKRWAMPCEGPTIDELALRNRPDLSISQMLCPGETLFFCISAMCAL